MSYILVAEDPRDQVNEVIRTYSEVEDGVSVG